MRENDISAPASATAAATQAYIGHNIASKEMMGSSGPVALFGHVCGAWDKRTAMIASFLLFFPSPVVMDRTVTYSLTYLLTILHDCGRAAYLKKMDKHYPLHILARIAWVLAALDSAKSGSNY